MPEHSPSDTPTPAWRPAAAVIAMLVGVVVTYSSPELFRGEWRIQGMDYRSLHEFRIDFALEQLRAHGTIPAWYPRELLGTPFWSNVQNFPFMPQRLILLPFGAESLFTLAVNLSAILAAVFTYLYARSIGIGVVGAATSGWTFACAGFFASRVGVGHVGVLEAYPALPALLWAMEKIAAPRASKDAALWFLILCALTASFALASHPQIAIYSIVTAGAYALWRCRSHRALACGAIALGAGVAMVQLWPMIQLIRRSTRLLALDPAANDQPLPIYRLASMLLPWHDGAPASVHPGAGVSDFVRADVSVFWDTFCYLGWLPIFAVVILAIALARRSRPSAAAGFLIVMSAVALLLALQMPQKLLPESPYLILRSPARLMYLVTFGLAIATGAAVTVLMRLPRVGPALAAVIIVGHVADLGWHDRAFLRAWRSNNAFPPDAEQAIRAEVADGRIGMDFDVGVTLNRRLDDVGFFDSIILANVYQSLLDLCSLPQRMNIQRAEASQLPARALTAAGARLIVTSRPIAGARAAERIGQLYIYQPAHPAARAAFFPAGSERYLSRDQTRAALRDKSVDVRVTLMLHPDAEPFSPPRDDRPVALPPTSIPVRRPNPDRIVVSTAQPTAGFVRVLESYDPGWRATVDGKSVPVFEAHNMVMAVPVTAGTHEVALEFFTPGAWTGRVISAGAVIGIVGVFVSVRRRRSASAEPGL